MKRYRLTLAFLITLLCGCAAAPESIRDVRDLCQNHAFYLNAQTASADLLTAAAQQQMDEDYNIIHFSVWHQSEPFHALPHRVIQDFDKFALRRGYGENKKLHPPSWIRGLRQNANLDVFPNRVGRGITIRNTDLRVLPTSSPHFYDRDGDAWAWPFDNLQRSTVAVNTPLYICHTSRNGAWLLVETSFTFGWLPAQDVATVDDEFIQTWETGRYGVITRDFTTVHDERGRFLTQTFVGHLFPLLEATDGRLQLLVAVADENRNAAVRRGYVSADSAAPKPLRLTAVNAARIANEMIGEPYGWGGMYGRRDCSSMTRDFFAVFGIWLPRHSEDQVREAGEFIDLADLPPREKERTILEKGVPYLSLLWRKGHVMLYIGKWEGRALIFHNIWGVRTKDLRGREGRKIIGQAVITTLEPGRELRDIDSAAGSLLQNITAMNILLPPRQLDEP